MSLHSDEPSTVDIAFLLWAKTERNGDRWHALPYHLLDVGATASVLWDNLPESSQNCATRVFNNPTTARQCVIFLAAAHDIGKANRYFQAKDPRHIPRLAHLGVAREDEQKKHGQVTTALLAPWLKSTWGWGECAATHVAVAVGGHHGIFCNSIDRKQMRLDQGYVTPTANALLSKLAEIYELPTFVPEPNNLNAFLAWLAGFVSVADWLGSHKTMTEIWCREKLDLGVYAREALSRAKTLFVEIDWTLPVTTTRICVKDLIPAGFAPNELQTLANSVAKENFSFAIIEAPTGEGKTEAAFALCETWRCKGDGVYFALPTMATANGLFNRVEAYLRCATKVDNLSATLLHSQAWLYRNNISTISNPSQDESQVECENWFDGSKRGLLTPYGVGTIDQCLFASLITRHGFIRLFALAGKTVLFDEVHAYDVYMSDLLERLLQWLRALGCRVILLSATLPASRRKELLRAWEGTDIEKQESYPCITWVDDAGVSQSKHFDVVCRKPVKFQLTANDETASWMTGALKIAMLVTEQGGFGALIFNTVKCAQDAYGFLRDSLEGNVEVELFHARFTTEDRERKERLILATYGKDGIRGTPRILVATQVVEQSLDLDFDHMVSELAPIDLLIQRAGRLHRHARNSCGQLLPANQSDERPDPTIFVVGHKVDLHDASKKLKEGVYAVSLLKKTNALLEIGLVLREACDVANAVEKVYDNESQLNDRLEWQSLLEDETTREKTKTDRAKALAADAMICEPFGITLLTSQMNYLDENDETPGSHLAARTRLEEVPSANLVIVFPQDDWPPLDFDKNVKKHLALRTVRTPVYGNCLAELLAIPRPNKWAQTSAINFSTPIQLNNQGEFDTLSHTFSYNSEIGLVTKRKNA